jgi:hypothetical protein
MICSIDSCGKPRFNKTLGLCAMHYARHQRHGDPLHTPHSGQRREHPKCVAGCACGKHKAGWASRTKYRLLFSQHDHPIANRGGWLYEHRKVLYDAIGPGPHPCHWCSVVLTWGGMKGIISDHMNRNKRDNRPENLVPSCQTCNTTRVGVA